jgi:hypothetical protein
MVCRSAFASLLLTLAVFASQPVLAGTIAFTGDVEVDFPIASGNGVVAIIDNPNGLGQSDTNDVAQASQLPSITGWNIKDVRMRYDSATDTMFFGVNFFGIAGDADGDGNPGSSSIPIGSDEANLGGRESIVVGIDTNNDGTPDVVAGVPSAKPADQPGVNYFDVAKYQKSPNGMSAAFGTSLPEHKGSLLFNPSAQSPDFLFTVNNFKKLPGLDPAQGFTVNAFAGTPDDIYAGEDMIFGTRIAFPAGGSGGQEPVIPEPATVLAWSTVLGAGLLWRYRKARRPQA